MSDYPELSEIGKIEAQAAIDRMKSQFKKAAICVIEKELGDMYTDIAEWVETDSWTNYKDAIIRHVSGYKDLGVFEAKKIRDKILLENRSELVKEINNDMVKEIADLKSHIEILQSYNRG